MGIEQYFTDLLLLAGFVTLVSEFIFGKLLKVSGTVAQVGSWVVAEAVTFFGFFTGVGGILTDVTQIWVVAVYGLAAGLVANGIFDINIVKALLEFLKLRVKKP